MTSMKISTARLLPAALVLLASLGTAQSAAERQSELAREHFRQVRELYAMPTWPRGVVRDGMPFAALALEGWRAHELRADAGLLSRTFGHDSGASVSPSFLVEARVCDSAIDAHEVLVTWLAGLASDRAMPSLREWKLDIGDTGFVGPSGAREGAIAWLAFVRGNVALRLVATDPRREPGLDLAAIARQLDASIQARPALPAGTRPARPEIVELSAGRTSVVAGQNLPLRVQIADPAAGTPHLEWILGGPGQGYVEQDSDGQFVLHTTAAGNLTLTLAATASLGTFSTLAIELTIVE